MLVFKQGNNCDYQKSGGAECTQGFICKHSITSLSRELPSTVSQASLISLYHCCKVFTIFFCFSFIIESGSYVGSHQTYQRRQNHHENYKAKPSRHIDLPADCCSFLANRQKIPGNRRSGDRHYHWNASGTGMDTFRESKNRHYLYFQKSVAAGSNPSGLWP